MIMKNKTMNNWFCKALCAQTRKSKLIYLLVFISLLTSGGIQAQQLIKGYVESETNEPLMGVTVNVKEHPNIRVISDLNGNFSINVPSTQVTLVFQYVGFKKQEYPLKGASTVRITLSEDSQLIDEVVVIGYGVSKKSDLTGSVASVKAEDLEKFPVANVTEMLRGQAPGIRVTLDQSTPGGSSKVLIRGNRSLSSGQTPLYLVDGMIVPHIDDLNSSDIASIEILKDASSQAIYGSRASNGVILITTKRGEVGKTQVDVNSYVGFQTYHRNFDMYSPDEFVKLRFWAKYNEGMSGIGTYDDMNVENVLDDAVMYRAYQNNNFTDWEDLMLSNAAQHKHDVSIRGGATNLKYSAGIGYFNQDGLVKNSGYERATFNSSVDFIPYKWLDLGTSFSYTKDKKQSADGNFNEIITMPTMAQAYDEEGSLNREVSSEGTINPLWKNKEYDKKVRNEYLRMTAYLTFKPFKDFSYRFDVNVRSGNRETGDYKTKLYPGSTGEGSISTYNRQSYQINNVIDYQIPTWNDKHKLSVTLIQSIEQDLQKTTGYSFINSTSDMFQWNIAQDAEVKGTTRTLTRTRSASFAGRIQYNLLDRYLLTASIRRDGASVFGPNNKWANFPSVALAWRMNEESFLKDVTWIDMLKLRLSYGIVGNWAISPYRTLGVAGKHEYLIDDQLVVGYLPSTELLNKDLKWETTNSLNFGVDFTAFGGRLNATLEHYKTRTKDLLVKRTVPGITGYSTMWDNLGKTKSWGWEAAVSGTVVKNRDMEWRLGGSISIERSEIVRIDGRTDENGKPINDITNKWFIGESINSNHGYVFGGIWQIGETPTENDYLPGDAEPVPGDIKLADYNGDGKITTDDRKIYNYDPDWYATINTALKYKGMDLSLEFYTVQNITKNNPYYYAYDQGGSLNGKKNGIKVNYWTTENPSNEAPRPQYTAGVSNFGVLAYKDASYFRLRSATLGYTFPKKIISKFNMEKLRVYFTGTNLFTVTDYKSYSPEKEPGSYPEPQTYTFGVNLSF